VKARKRRSGMLLGKFLPPHLGHQYLVDFARSYVERLTVLVCSIEREPIPGALRYAWMREMCPGCEVIHVTDEVPQAPEDHPDFWDIWRELIRRHVPAGPDCVFASEPYGARLSAELGADFVPVDVAREMVPVSSTAVRADPMGHWRYIPAPVRPYFVRRVCLVGAESTGKSTLALRLAERFGTVCVQEYARPWLAPKPGRCDPEDIPAIARGQIAAEDALARQADRLIICDTDALTTLVWSEILFGDAPDWLRHEARTRRYDVTLLLDTDAPWIDDGTRMHGDPAARRAFGDRCAAALEAHGRPYIRLGGTWEERFTAAVSALEALVARAR
jgi:HTH-type transcriptional regulator, transcriptional repressor of NAD biosynthesis genes